jgi:tetratricopeptide (TPR) repeat protein
MKTMPWEKRPWPWLLLAAALVAYANGLNGDFTYDDKAIVRDNLRIQRWENLPQIFTTHYFGGSLATGTSYRPVDLLSFAANYLVHGTYLFGYHAVNVGLHVAVTWLLFFLFRRRFGESTAGIAALLFAVTPVHVEAVTSIVGRAELLAAFFLLAAWILADRAFARGRRFAFGAWILYFLAILTKESAVVLPAFLFVEAMTRESGSFFRRAASLLRRRALFYFSFAIPLAATFALRFAVLKGFLISKMAGFFELENPLVSLSPFVRAGNAAAILIRSLGRIVFPAWLSADESAWQLPLYRPGSLLFWAALAAVLLFLAAGVVLFTRRPAAGFGILFFFIASLPTSNFLFATGTIMAERLMYLPSAGIALAAAAFFPTGEGELGRRRGPAVLLAAFVLLLLFRTISRNPVWESDETLFTNLVLTSPDSAKAHYDKGYAEADRKRFRPAYDRYALATGIYARYYDAWAGRGRMAGELGDIAEAVEDGRRSVAIYAPYENGWFTIANESERRGDMASADAAYRDGLRNCPTSYPLAYHRAVFLFRTGRLDEAIEAYRRAIALAPDMALNHEDLGRIFWARGWTEKAEEEWDAALDIFPTDGVALSGEARIAEERRDDDEAADLRLTLFEASRDRSDLLALLDDTARSGDGARDVASRWDAWARRQPALFSDPAVTARRPAPR